MTPKSVSAVRSRWPQYKPGEVKEVALHDGSIITLKKLEREYDPTDRHAAFDALQKCEFEGKVLTGLFYIDPDTVPYQEVDNLIETPLVELSVEQLRPSKEALDEVMESLK